MIDPKCAKCWPNHCVHGEQSEDLEAMELAELRVEVARLNEQLNEIAGALGEDRENSDGKPLSIPNAIALLKLKCEAMKEFEGRLQAERDGAISEASAAKRERDQARSALEDLHAMVSRRGSCVGVAALLSCTADGIESLRMGYAEGVAEEREACCEDVRDALTTGLLTPGQVQLAINAIRKRGGR